jgi:hypothetical protein
MLCEGYLLLCCIPLIGVLFFKLSLPVSSVFVYPFCRLYILAAEISIEERGIVLEVFI